jgi:O-antigen/teichoic acid export membrane protein
VLKYTRGDAETGQYTAALKLFSILTLLPASLTQVIYPILSGFYAAQKEKLPKAFRDSLRVMALVSIPVALGTIVLAARIIGFVYAGKDFSPAIPVLAILVGGVSVGHLNWVITSLLLSVNRQKITMIATLLVAIVAVIANMVLVPSFGPQAVAWIVTGTDTVLFLSFFLYLARTEYAIGPFALFGKPLLAALCMSAVLLVTPQLHILLAVPLGIMTYAGVMILLRGFGQQEREMMQGLLRRL